MDEETIYLIGVDVGSGSVRAALVDSKGHVLKSSVREIQTWKPAVDFYEQSSDNIWDCCVNVIKVKNKIKFKKALNRGRLVAYHPRQEC